MYNTKLGAFCAEHDNWQELLTQEPYCLKIKEDGDYIMFSYDQIRSNFNIELVREARGIIFRAGEWEYPACRAFDKFFNYGESNAADIDWNTAFVTEKVDGCFSKKDCVLLADGSKKPIGEIVNKKLNCEVLSYNFETGKIEPKKVIGWKRGIENFNDEDWLTFYLRGVRQSLSGKKSQHSILTATKNHQIFVKQDDQIIEKSAEDLTTSDIVLTPVTGLTKVEEQVIYGGLLGDGWLTYANDTYGSSGFEFCHSVKQLEYAQYKASLLNALDIRERIRTNVNSYGSTLVRESTKVSPAMIDAKNICYRDGKKHVTMEWLQKLDWPGFAIWYMDDGYRNTSAKNNAIGMAVEGFSLTEIECIQAYYLSLGYKSSITSYRNYYKLTFSTEASDRIWQNIRCFIPECMQYKLPERHRGFFDNKWGETFNTERPIKLIEAAIVEIKPGMRRKNIQGTRKYDIEVEDNHNYFCGGILVHNSLIKLWFDDTWHISTNGTIDAFKAELGDVRMTNFGAYFLKTLDRYTRAHVFRTAFEEFTADLDEQYTYMFELVGPYNRVVIPYDEPELYFLGARNKFTGEEYLPIPVNASNLGVSMFKRPAIYSLSSLDDCIKAAELKTWDDEGFVVCDANFNRVKIKSPAYVLAHFMRNNNVITRKHIIKIILENEVEEFLCYATDYKEELEKVKKLMNSYHNIGNKLAQACRQMILLERKDYAKLVQALPKIYQGLLYLNYDRFMSAQEFTKDWSENKWDEYLTEVEKLNKEILEG